MTEQRDALQNRQRHAPPAPASDRDDQKPDEQGRIDHEDAEFDR